MRKEDKRGEIRGEKKGVEGKGEEGERLPPFRRGEKRRGGKGKKKRGGNRRGGEGKEKEGGEGEGSEGKRGGMDILVQFLIIYLINTSQL